MSQFSPTDWWKVVMKKASRLNRQSTVKFATFMMGLQSCPTSSAGIERWFSTVGFVWGKTRNRLGMKKAEMLAACYRALRPSRHRNPSSLTDQGQEQPPAATAAMPIVRSPSYSNSAGPSHFRPIAANSSPTSIGDGNGDRDIDVDDPEPSPSPRASAFERIIIGLSPSSDSESD